MQAHKKIMLRSFAKSICVAEGSASTANQLYTQRKQRQPVIHADKAQATSYTSNPAKHSPPVVQAAQAQATSYTSSASTGNQLYRQRKHRQPVIHAAQAQATQAQATSYTGSASTNNQLYR